MTKTKSCGFLAGLAAAAVLAMGITTAGIAADGAPAAQASKEAQATELDPGEHRRVQGIASQLRCLVCQNQSIADSDADLAVDLRKQVIEQINAGRSDKEINDYMVERYGDFVLYNPPFKASTVILWLGPVVLFLAAAVAFYINLRRRKSSAQAGGRALTPDEKRRAEALLKGK